MALTKIARADLLAIVSTASNAVTLSSALDCSTYYSADIRIRMGRGTGTAFTVGPKVRIEGSAVNGSPTADQWAVLATFQMAVGASIVSTAVSGTEAAGQTVVSLTSGTNVTAGDYLFFHNSTIGNSEWCRAVSIATNDVTIEEGLVAAQTGATCRDQSEQYHCVVDLTGINRLRAIVDGAGSGQAVICHVDLGGTTGL
jgi:hypothetical protein